MNTESHIMSNRLKARKKKKKRLKARIVGQIDDQPRKRAMEPMRSLPVANVQALAATIHGEDVPPRYVRPEKSSNHVICDGSVEIPVVDFGRLFDPQSSVEESAKLDRACEEWGFFQLINHTVPAEVIERTRVDIEEFFRLPLETKRQLAQQPGQLEGYGQLFVISEEQKLDWADMLYLNAQPVCSRNMKLRQKLPVTFRSSLTEDIEASITGL